MGFPAVTYTFSNSTTADATQVNQNFTDILNGISDGTKNINISALTASGTFSLTGSGTLGNSASNTLTFNSSLASSIPILTDNSYDIGSATFGLRAIYFGANSQRVKIQGSSSMSGAVTITLPATAGNAADTLETDGSNNLSFVSRKSPDYATNYGFTVAMAANAVTVTLVGANGSAPSASNPVDIVFRSATAATGTPQVVRLTATMNIVIPSGATLGLVSGVPQDVHLYMIQDTTNEIGVAGSKLFDEGTLQSATAITSGSTSLTTLYATGNHTSRPVRYLGRFRANEVTAGTWATSASEISTLVAPPYFKQIVIGAAQTANGTHANASFGNPSNQPTVTLTALNSCKYKISCSWTGFNTTGGATTTLRINNSSGGATVNFSQEDAFDGTGANLTGYVWMIATLGAGTAYTFTLQTKESAGTFTLASATPTNGIAILVEQIE